MVDRPPPSRFSVVERGGRLVVIDKETGQTPLSAAERMAQHDRRMGHERSAPIEREAAPLAVATTAPAPARRTETAPPRPDERLTAAVAEMNKKRPWKDSAPSAKAPQPARIAERPQPQPGGSARGRKTVVTGKWWDAKGPRTIELGAKGQQVLSGGFMTLFFVGLIAAIVALVISPVILFIGAFLLFRFGGNILGPLGAGIVDKAIAERN